MNHFVELVTFRTKAGVTLEQVASAAESKHWVANPS